MIGSCLLWHLTTHWHLLIKCCGHLHGYVVCDTVLTQCDKLKTSHGMTLNLSVMRLFEQLLIVTTGNCPSVSINKYFTEHKVYFRLKRPFARKFLWRSWWKHQVSQPQSELPYQVKLGQPIMSQSQQFKKLIDVVPNWNKNWFFRLRIEVNEDTIRGSLIRWMDK